MMRFILIGVACIFTCMAGIGVAADELGRLFFSPAQRAQLDAARAQRDRRLPVTASMSSDTTELPAPLGPEVVTYEGVVRRSDGKSTVWINGRPMTERTRDGDVNVLGVRRDGSVSVAVPQADRSASLRVGQSMDVISGRIEEPYARDVTRLRPPAKPVPAIAPTTPPAGVAVPTAAAKSVAQRDKPDPDSGATPPGERGSIK